MELEEGCLSRWVCRAVGEGFKAKAIFSVGQLLAKNVSGMKKRVKG
jgi:hypothetical protein